jgi:hypothetical protein
VVERIDAELEVANITTHPDYTTAWIDAAVTFDRREVVARADHRPIHPNFCDFPSCDARTCKDFDLMGVLAHLCPNSGASNGLHV